MPTEAADSIDLLIHQGKKKQPPLAESGRIQDLEEKVRTLQQEQERLTLELRTLKERLHHVEEESKGETDAVSKEDVAQLRVQIRVLKAQVKDLTMKIRNDTTDGVIITFEFLNP